jgi:CTP:molybdopterin cytidylyltransferase MocA/ADP-ribose pyrophosphatase YjhB (NUDIX family)
VTAKVAVIVLAGGQSSRLGRPKQLLLVSGQPLLERTLDVTRHLPLEPKVVVTGAYDDEITTRVDLRGFRRVHNPAFATGQASSLKAGLAALPDDIDGVVVMLGDQPLVPAWLIERLAATFDPNRHAAVRPRYADGPGNPVLLGRSLFPELMQLKGDVGARGVLQRHRNRVADVPVPMIPAPGDVDTMDDYAALLEDWSASGAPDVPRYCLRCAAEVGFQVKYGRSRPVCPACGYTYFYDPKIAAAAVVEIDGRVVLQRRRIDPGSGKWSIPGGFVDRGETVQEAAAREVAEEVGLTVGNLDLIGVYSEPGETVVLIAWSASAQGQQPTLGDESDEIGLFTPDALPEMAFHRDRRVLEDWARRRTLG